MNRACGYTFARQHCGNGEGSSRDTCARFALCAPLDCIDGWGLLSINVVNFTDGLRIGCMSNSQALAKRGLIAIVIGVVVVGIAPHFVQLARMHDARSKRCLCGIYGH